MLLMMLLLLPLPVLSLLLLLLLRRRRRRRKGERRKRERRREAGDAPPAPCHAPYLVVDALLKLPVSSKVSVHARGGVKVEVDCGFGFFTSNFDALMVAAVVVLVACRGHSEERGREV